MMNKAKKQRRWKNLWFFLGVILILTSLFFVSTKLFASHPKTSAQKTPTHASFTWIPQQAPPLMSGDVLWKGVPSMLWGTNETQIWDGDNSILTEPVIQKETKADHLALIRTWLFQIDLATNQPESDSYQESKVHASLATGAKLLCELATKNSMSYDEHMVSLFRGQCSYYEFMNEPDNENVPIATYVSEWSSEIPRLRAIDPQAKFGGTAAAAPQYNQCTYGATTTCYMQKVLQGMAQNKILPDFVTFHYYPCWDDTATSCMQKATALGDQVRLVRSWVNDYFGKAGMSIPVGVTEWNADPSAPMPSYTKDPCWMEQFTTTAEESIAKAGASFATQLDLADYGGYGTDDMVDIFHNGKAKPQYYALLHVIDQISPYGALPMPPLAFTQPAKCTILPVE